MCQYGSCDWTAEYLVTSNESGETIAVCVGHLHIGTDPERIVS